MSLSTFLENIRTPANFLQPWLRQLPPHQDLEKGFRAAPIWLTPSAVQGFDRNDFLNLPKQLSDELERNVHEFEEIAKEVPDDLPPTDDQVLKAIPRMLKILDIIGPSFDDEAIRARQLLDAQQWPDYVLGFYCEIMHLSNDDPSLWVTVGVRDDVATLPKLAEIGLTLRRQIKDTLEKYGMQLRHYVRIRSASEREVFYEKTE